MYFDWSATTIKKPQPVIDAVVKAMESYANPARGSYGAAMEGLHAMHKTRKLVADYFGVPKSSNVAFTLNATHSLNIAISSVKGHIITTAAEHNSILRPVYRHGNFTIVPVDSQGNLDLNRLESAIKPDTQAIALTHSSNVTGNVYDIKAIGEICKRHNILFIVDGAQSAGVIDINMADVGISALCFSGHKSLYGPQGVGAICINDDFSPTPIMVGGSGILSFETHQPKQMPQLLEAGTQNTHGIAGLGAAIEWANSSPNNSKIALDYARDFYTHIRENENYIIYGNFSAPRTPIVTLNLKGMDSGDLANILYEDYSVAVRGGFHCAPLMHKAMGKEKTGAVRFSFSHLNTPSEMKILAEIMKEISIKYE